MRNRILLFIASCGLGGLCAALGSIVGNAGGKTGLFVGGVVGGLLGAIGSALLAGRLEWVRPQRVRLTAIGAGLGFLLAALIATQTLSSPVGPVLSTGLIGVGAILGAGAGRD